jgi:heat shock protein HslJ
MKKIFLTLPILAALAGAGCMTKADTDYNVPPTEQQPTGTPTSTTETGNPLADELGASSWEMASIKSATSTDDVSSFKWSFSFKDGSLSGKICNSMSGRFQLDEETLIPGPIMMTKMFCEGKPGIVESNFVGATRFKVAIEDEQLWLTDETSNVSYIFDQAAAE